MKLSLRGEYALRALVVLGAHYPKPVLSIQMISEQQNIPKRYLEQILGDLKTAGVLESKRGISGGYRLAQAPEKVTLAHVIRHMEGALAPVTCVSERFYKKCTCPDEAKCGIRSVMKEVRDAIAKILENFTVADLCQRAQHLESEQLKRLDFVI